MNAVEITAETFAALKTGQIVRLSFAGCMSHGTSIELKVGRRSFSKKWGVASLGLEPLVGKSSPLAKLRLMARKCGRVSLAQGDMATVITAFEVIN